MDSGWVEGQELAAQVGALKDATYNEWGLGTVLGTQHLTSAGLLRAWRPLRAVVSVGGRRPGWASRSPLPTPPFLWG